MRQRNDAHSLLCRCSESQPYPCAQNEVILLDGRGRITDVEIVEGHLPAEPVIELRYSVRIKRKPILARFRDVRKELETFTETRTGRKRMREVLASHDFTAFQSQP